MGQTDGLALGAFKAQWVGHQLYKITVRVVDVGVVLTGIFARALIWVCAPGADKRASAGPGIGDSQGIQMRQSLVPVFHFHREVYLRHRDERLGNRRVNLGGTDTKLKLAFIQRRPPVQELGAQNFFVPFPSLLAVCDLDVDVVNHADS